MCISLHRFNDKRGLEGVLTERMESALGLVRMIERYCSCQILHELFVFSLRSLWGRAFTGILSHYSRDCSQHP